MFRAALAICLDVDCRDPAASHGAQSERPKENASFWLSQNDCIIIALHDSLRAASFSAPIRWNSLRSRAEGDAPAIAARIAR